MLYAATRQPLYLGAGVLLGCGAGVLAYKLFKHVRIRVMVWKDPFANWNYGYQVGQALFAIGTGGWFGMVERIEGFCSEEDWKRAYKEINEMEASWVKEGAIVLKFWLHIDKDEQERRFRERMDTPSKQWKITDEDWRNREKWDQYLEAVNEMIFRTSKETAPWIIVEGDCKYYARIKVMDCDAGELISVYYGEDTTEENANAFTAKLQELYPDYDIECHKGGQPVYYYVVSIE